MHDQPKSVGGRGGGTSTRCPPASYPPAVIVDFVKRPGAWERIMVSGPTNRAVGRSKEKNNYHNDENADFIPDCDGPF